MHTDLLKNIISQASIGVLSSLSVSYDQHPFSSLVTTRATATGLILMRLSLMAEHTKNIEQDSRASLLVWPADAMLAQDKPRVTLLGRVHKSSDQALAQKLYYASSKEEDLARSLADFFVYEFIPEKARLIGGFGMVGWMDREQYQSLWP